MSVAELQWLIGTAVGAVLAIAGIAITAFRAMSAKLDRTTDRIEDAMKVEDGRLHERINRVRDEYVRRDDLDSHLKRFEAQLSEIRGDVKKTLELMAKPK